MTLLATVMTKVTRAFVLTGACLAAVAAAAAAVTVWSGAGFSLGTAETVQLRVDVDGVAETRMLVAIAAGAIATVLSVASVITVSTRSRRVTLWLSRQERVELSAEAVERVLLTAVQGVKGVEAAKVVATPSGHGTTALALDLTVARGADAPLVASEVEARIQPLLAPACTIVLGERPSITIRYAMSPDVQNRQPHAA